MTEDKKITEEKQKESPKKNNGYENAVQYNDKNKLHGNYFMDVPVECICGNKFTINTAIPGPIKVETCYDCHPTYNKDKVIKKVVKGRMEKFLEKQKKMKKMS